MRSPLGAANLKRLANNASRSSLKYVYYLTNVPKIFRRSYSREQRQVLLWL